MSNTITLKKSGVSGNAPSSSDLSLGEIALNYADGHLYYKSGASATPAKLNAGDADTLDGSHASAFLLKTGGDIVGNVDIDGTLSIDGTHSISLGQGHTISASGSSLNILGFDNSAKVNFIAHGSAGGKSFNFKVGTHSSNFANVASIDDSGNATFAGSATVEGGVLNMGKADTASAHINSKELMTFNIDTDNDDTNRYFAWYVNGESGSGTQLLKILENGNATFAGDVLAEDNLYLTDAGTVRGKIQLNSSDRDNLDIKAVSLGSLMRFYTANTLALTLDASQNATFAGTVTATSFHGDGSNLTGLSSSTDNTKLPLAGGNMTGHILLNNGIELRSKDTSSNIKTITRVNSSNELEYGWSGGGPVKFMGGGSYTERMRIHTNGNVGIGAGATAPADKLTIQEDSADFSIRKTDGTLSARIVQFGSGASELRLYDAAAIQKVSVNTVGDSYFNGGNVGIGTASPAAKLDISDSQTQSGSGTATIKSTATTTATSTQSSGMYKIQNFFNLTGTGGSFQNAAHQQVQTTVSSTGTGTNLKNHLSRVHTSGSGQISNVAHYNIHTELGGNGTINKWMGYAVADGTLATFENTGHTITNTYGLYIGDITSGTQTNTPYGVYQASTDMENYFGGKVGIGTTSPATQLHVAGRARFDDSQINARGVFADYFSSGQSLTLNSGADASILFKIGNTTALTLDSSENATFAGDVVVSGGLTINGTTTTINSTTLQVDDKNIELGTVGTPTDVTADGGGITLKGATDKTINWVNSTDAWTFSERVAVPAGSAAAPALTFSSDTDTGVYRFTSGSNDHLGFSTGGVLRGHWGPAGLQSSANVYTAATSEFRNYSGVWKGTTGLTGNGFQFINSVDGTAMTLSSSGEMVVTGSVTATNLSLTSLSAQNSEATALMVNGSNVVGTRELGSNAFTSTTFAPLASPALTGNPTAPTQASSENSTKIATTAYVKGQGYITSANGGNAATLDGIDSTSFLRSDANDNTSDSARLTLGYKVSNLDSVGGLAGVTPFRGQFQATNNAGTGNYNTGLEFVFSDTGAKGQLVFASNGNNNIPSIYARTEGWTADNGWHDWYKLWHEGNDGGGSGLDADKLDGLHASSFVKTSGDSVISGSLIVDDITINASNISDAGDLYIDAGGDISIDADGGDIILKDGGTIVGTLSMNQSGGNFEVRSRVSNKDLVFKGNDGSSEITALTLDMSDGGAAAFGGDINLGTGKSVYMSGTNGLRFLHDGSNGNFINGTGDFKVTNGAVDKDIIFRGNDGGSSFTALTLDMSDGGTATFNHNVNLPDGGQLNIGANADLYLTHDDNNGYFYNNKGDLFIDQTANDADIVFKGTDNTADITALRLDMSDAGTAIFNHNISLPSSGQIDFNAGDIKFVHSSNLLTLQGGNLAISGGTITASGGGAAPNAPASASATVVGETVEVTFAASTTSNIDAYLVYSSIDGSDYGLISIVPPDDFASSMSIIDNAFDQTGTQAYRVYASKLGKLSSAQTASVSYSVSSAEPTSMSVVNLNNAYYVQWNPPSSNARFVTLYNVYKHEHATQGSLSRSSASLVYTGMNTNYMYQISGTNNNNFHQFWVETTIA